MEFEKEGDCLQSSLAGLMEVYTSQLLKDESDMKLGKSLFVATWGT